MTVSDLDIYRSANLLVNQHSDEAPIRAAKDGEAWLLLLAFADARTTQPGTAHSRIRGR